MTSYRTFGSPDRFEISLGWLEDNSPRQRRPLGYGWSLGSIKIVVRGFCVTEHDESGVTSDSVSWYLYPLLRWIADNWNSLFYEEAFQWPERSIAPAALACGDALDRFLPIDDNQQEDWIYERVRDWWERHALRAGASGGLLPDLFFRRVGDEMEVSWSGRQVDFAPEGYRFLLAAGVATLPIEDIAGPLWAALQWLADKHSASTENDLSEIVDFKAQLRRLLNTPQDEIEDAHLGSRLAQKVRVAFDQLDRPDMLHSYVIDSAPVAIALSAPVAMFGGVNPSLTMRDVRALSKILISQNYTVQQHNLNALVDNTVGLPLSKPHNEGYNLAEQLIDNIDIPYQGLSVDIRQLIISLGIKIIDRKLETNRIRGVALAGDEFAPTIVLNSNSPFYTSEPGRRFTLAHELFHILYDRSRARRVSHISGPWAAPGVEKRANAFAAMLLMPRASLSLFTGRKEWDHPLLRKAAAELAVSETALSEHLYNIGYIDEVQRDVLRWTQ